MLLLGAHFPVCVTCFFFAGRLVACRLCILFFCGFAWYLVCVLRYYTQDKAASGTNFGDGSLRNEKGRPDKNGGSGKIWSGGYRPRVAFSWLLLLLLLLLLLFSCCCRCCCRCCCCCSHIKSSPQSYAVRGHRTGSKEQNKKLERMITRREKDKSQIT